MILLSRHCATSGEVPLLCHELIHEMLHTLGSLTVVCGRSVRVCLDTPMLKMQ